MPAAGAAVERKTKETQIAAPARTSTAPARSKIETADPVLQPHAGGVVQARPDGPRAWTPRATSRWTSTTRWRTSGSASARRFQRGARATSAGSSATATPTCRWTRRCCTPRSTSRAGRSSSSTCRSRATRVSQLRPRPAAGLLPRVRVQRGAHAARQPCTTARTSTTSPRRVFKAVGRALAEATRINPRIAGVLPSTKGAL